MRDPRMAEELVMDLENELDFPLGPSIEEVLEELVEQLDGRYRRP